MNWHGTWITWHENKQQTNAAQSLANDYFNFQLDLA